MKVSNTPAFCGRIPKPACTTGIEHLLTKRVRTRMQFAPKGTELIIEKDPHSEYVGVGFTIESDRCNVMRFDGVFVAPIQGRACISGIFAPKRYYTEGNLLNVIREGLIKLKMSS